MRRISRLRPSPAMVVASLALFVALGGVGYAALNLPTGSVKSKHLAAGSVKKSEIASTAVGRGELASAAVSSGDVANGSLRPADLASDAARRLLGVSPVAGIQLERQRRLADEIVRRAHAHLYRSRPLQGGLRAHRRRRLRGPRGDGI